MTCTSCEGTNKHYRITVQDLLLPSTVSQKDEKPHTAGLEYIAPIKIKISEIPQYRKPKCPPHHTLKVEQSVCVIKHDTDKNPLITVYTQHLPLNEQIR